MATQTEHLGLHQWEPNDDFLRSDFNEDHGKIDAAVGAVAAAVEGVRPAAGSVKHLVTQDIVVELGFKPKLLILEPDGARAVFFVMQGISKNLRVNPDDSRVKFYGGQDIKLTETGFTISAGAATLNDDLSDSDYYVAIQ